MTIRGGRGRGNPGLINHREQDVIEYLRSENRVLREKLGKKRIALDQGVS